MKKWILIILTLCLLPVSACRPMPTEMPDWGITLTAENVTAEGCTLVCTQSGGSAEGSFSTGLNYFLAREGKRGFEEILRSQEYSVPALGLGIPREETVRWDLTWGHMYGPLPPGNYRVCKVIDRNNSADQTRSSCTFWADFTIPEVGTP